MRQIGDCKLPPAETVGGNGECDMMTYIFLLSRERRGLKQAPNVLRSSQSLLIALQLLKWRSPNEESEKTFVRLREPFISISLTIAHQRQKNKPNNKSRKC